MHIAMQWWTSNFKGCILNENLVNCWLSMDFEKLRRPQATNLLVSWWALKEHKQTCKTTIFKA